MAHHQLAAEFVIVVDCVEFRRLLQMNADHRDRDCFGNLRQVIVRQPRSYEDEPVHLPIDHRVDHGMLGRGGGLAYTEQRLVLGADQRLVYAGHDVGEERIVQVGQQHAERVGLAAHAPGRRMWPIAELLHRGLHPGAQRLAHAISIAQHL